MLHFDSIQVQHLDAHCHGNRIMIIIMIFAIFAKLQKYYEHFFKPQNLKYTVCSLLICQQLPCETLNKYTVLLGLLGHVSSMQATSSQTRSLCGTSVWSS